jgi:Arc/MetJ family transcription regulator
MTMRTNIVLDDILVQEALALSGAKTKRELVDRALRELVERLRRRDILDLYGSDGIDPDYDYKAARSGEA